MDFDVRKHQNKEGLQQDRLTSQQIVGQFFVLQYLNIKKLT